MIELLVSLVTAGVLYVALLYAVQRGWVGRCERHCADS